MALLIDTSVLGRLANTHDGDHAVAKAAVAELHRRGETLHVASQNLIEFRSFATRPVSANGLGLGAPKAEALSARFESAFALLADAPSVYPAWKVIVERLWILGKQVHDARLIAVCHVHLLTHLLTFNIAHFTRMGTLQRGGVVVYPSKV